MGTRRRRSAPEAREVILDAARRQLRARGPAGIRLQELAQELGISHPAILHHFGSKRGLVVAVVEQAVADLEGDIVAMLTADRDRAATAESLMAQVFRVMQDEGHARVLAWLALEGEQPRQEWGRQKLGVIADAVHQIRGHGSREDTAFTVLLAASAVFGDAIAGDRLRDSVGLGGDPEARPRFHRWLTRMLLAHLDGADV
jgi:AcrR family transcriptional regulator